MSHGVYIGERRFFSMRSRRDISVELCSALKFICEEHPKGRPRGVVRCGCREEEGIFPPLRIVEFWSREKRAFDYRLDRFSIDDPHSCHCVFRLPDDDLPHEPPVPTTLIFSPVSEMPSYTGVGLGKSGVGGVRYEQFCRLLISDGYNRAWFRANAEAKELAGLRNPAAIEILSEIDAVIRNTRLSDADNAYEGAEKSGGGLVFGLLESDLPSWVESAPPDYPVPIRMSGYRRGRLDFFHVSVPAGLIEDLRKQLSIFDHVVRAPYLFFAMVEPDWVVRRLFLKPIHCQNQTFVFVDSETERRFFEGQLSRGRTVFRSLDSMVGFAVLAGKMPLVDFFSGQQRWPFHPDAVVFSKSAVFVVEVRGFRKKSKPDYDELFGRKRVAWKLFCSAASVRVRFVEVRGWWLDSIKIETRALTGAPRGLVKQELPRHLFRFPRE